MNTLTHLTIHDFDRLAEHEAARLHAESASALKFSPSRFGLGADLPEMNDAEILKEFRLNTEWDRFRYAILRALGFTSNQSFWGIYQPIGGDDAGALEGAKDAARRGE